MASINLDIGSRFDSSGLDAMNKGIKGASSTVRRASSALGSVVDKLGEVDGAMGKVIKTGGNLLGNVMSAGVWGAVGAAVGVVVSKFADLHEQLKKNRDAAHELNESIASGEMDRRAAARVDRQLKRRAEKEKEAAEESAKARLEADRKAAAEHDRIVGMQKASMRDNAADADRAAQINIVEARLRGASADELGVMKARADVEKARSALRYAEEFGEDLAKAEDELTLAEIALEQAVKDQRDAVAKAAEAAAKKAQAEEDAARKVKDAADKAASKEASRRLAEERAAKAKEAGDKKLADIDSRLAAARADAAAREEAAARARGVSFNEWRRGEKARNREAERESKRQQGFIDRAKREQDQLQSRIFDRDGNLRKSANKRDVERWKSLNEFGLMQDPANNGALDDVKRLEEERAKAVQDMKTAIDKIKNKLDEVTM